MLNRLSKFREERAEGEKGFTLIELLVVVVILGILIAIAIPLYLNYRKGANDAAAKSDLRNAISTLETCNSDQSSYPTAVTATTGGPVTITGCGSPATQTINLSTNTSMNYTPISASAPVTSYILVTTNTGGTGKLWCYNSAKGGQVAQTTTATISGSNTTC